MDAQSGYVDAKQGGLRDPLHGLKQCSHVQLNGKVIDVFRLARERRFDNDSSLVFVRPLSCATCVWPTTSCATGSPQAHTALPA